MSTPTKNTASPFLTRTILMLSLVSFFTDVASEMVYPIMPLYLKQIGFSLIGIGLLEGTANLVTGLFKGYFGALSDAGRRLPFIRWGYFVSALAKPIMGLFVTPWIVFSARIGDRLGKGIRTAPRDALLTDESEKQHRGKVFGFHRALDTFGAATGPALALLFLYFLPGEYQLLFLFTAVPGLISVLLLFLIKESARKPSFRAKSHNPLSYFAYWSVASADYKKILAGMVLFTIFNSSDFFILLKCKQAGMTDQTLILAYIGYNLIYAGIAFPLGKRADKIGMKPVFVFGLILFAIVYAALGTVQSQPILFAILALYGCFTAATEGIARAWVSRHVAADQRGSGLGLFVTLQSLGLLAASLSAGFLWEFVSPEAPFLVSSGGALLAVLYFWRLKTSDTR